MKSVHQPSHHTRERLADDLREAPPEDLGQVPTDTALVDGQPLRGQRVQRLLEVYRLLGEGHAVVAPEHHALGAPAHLLE